MGRLNAISRAALFLTKHGNLLSLTVLTAALFARPALAQGVTEPVAEGAAPPFEVIFFDSGAFTIIDSDGHVLRQIQMPPGGGVWNLSADYTRLAYNANSSQPSYMYLYDFTTGANTYLFQADWGQTVSWLPGSNTQFVYNTPAGNLLKYDLATNLHTEWQSNDVLLPFGTNVFRAGPLNWTAALDKVVFVAGVGGGGDNQVYLADPCEIDESHHLCTVTPLGPPTSGWATVNGPADITPDGTKVYYPRRENWTTWQLIEHDLTTGIRRLLLSGTDPNGQGLGPVSLFGDNELAVLFPTLDPTKWDVEVCTLSPVFACRTVYSNATSVYSVQTGRPVAGAAPVITAHPVSQTIGVGAAATLTVAATGSAPLAYQWFQGESGDTANPIGGATALSYTTPPLTVTTNYWVRVDNAYGAADSNTATVTVAQPELIMEDIQVGESVGLALVWVRLSPPSPNTVTVHYQTHRNTALPDIDYLAITSTDLVFAPGDTAKMVQVTIVDDSVPERAENFTVTLTEPTGGAILAHHHHSRVTINDDDGAVPSLSVEDTQVTEGDAGSTPATMAVTMSPSSSSTVTVSYTTESQTGAGFASAGSDFAPVSGQLTFAPGETNKSVSVDVYGDRIVEGTETFRLKIRNPTGGAQIANAWGTATIYDNDRPPAGTTIEIRDPVDPSCFANLGCVLLKERTTACMTKRVFVTDDNEALAAAGEERTGAATDGVTLLLLRVQANTPVTFGVNGNGSRGYLLQTDGCARGNSVTVSPVATSRGSYALAVYEAPLDFPNQAWLGNREVAQLTAVTSEGTLLADLALRPPPVVLVHGIWSDPQVWVESAWPTKLEPSFKVYLANYGSTRQRSAMNFDPTAADSRDVIGPFINAVSAAKRSARADGVAASQVDVIAHSLGGLVARAREKYAFEAPLQLSNFRRGDLHKLISIGTPHHGTALADWLIQNKCLRRFSTGPSIEEFFNGLERPLGMAVYGFQTGSPARQHLGRSSVPVHAIVGVAPSESAAESQLNLVPRWWGRPLISVDRLLGGNGNHDTVVSTESQQGSLVRYSHVLGVVHTDLERAEEEQGETESPEVLARARQLLLEDVTTSFQPALAPRTDGDFVPIYSCPNPGIRAVQGPDVVLLPAPGEMYRPGDVVPIDVAAPDGQGTLGAFIRVGDSVKAFEGAGPFEFEYRISDHAAGRLDIKAMVYGTDWSQDQSSFIDVLPEGTPERLVTAPGEVALTEIGQLESIRVMAEYLDGREIDVSKPSAGTIFAVVSGNANVVTVSPDGLVEAKGGGEDAIQVSFGAVTKLIPVTVNLTNLRPTLNPLADVIMDVGQQLDIPLTASDPDGNNLTFSLVSGPAFATVVSGNGGQGALQLRPGSQDIGTYSVAVAVTDDGLPALGDAKTLTVRVGLADLIFRDGFEAPVRR